MSETWPPAPSADTRWRSVDLRGDGEHRLRRVPLWGTEAWVEDGTPTRVLCEGCLRLLTTEELQEPHRGHRFGAWMQVQRVGHVVDLDRNPTSERVSAGRWQ